MGSALKIRDDLTPSFGAGLAWNRTVERRRGPMGSRMLWRRCPADAARLAGMDRQTLRDAVVRYNAKGLEGLHDRPKGYSPRRLTADEEAALRSSSPGRLSAMRHPGICAAGAKNHRPGFYGGWAPEPPAKGRRSAGALQKRGLRDILKATHPDKRLQLWFQDRSARRQQGPGVPTGGGAGASGRDGSVGLHLLRAGGERSIAQAGPGFMKVA